ncbi:hypothetical protein ADK86_06230 [Streptomyces sp. NRRL F-5755]|uniref:DUF2620 domain-containing protein n=1 Tax=Streptomyces sp. NRRL F-5755 TaxID=1519475 RepID=UPI0006AEBED3|nr:DUF2620 domain-containing protein [Streptomyces sp. NRRL F-5755]KOU06113.1 hypothetical protein ADK86_06230 [Streptomyces sp. NRRL F-5755]
MTTILTGGVGKTEVADAVRRLAPPGVEVVVSNDMDAVALLRAGRADYFLGTCQTGAGASLGVLVGLMGAATCHTFGRSVPSGEEINTLLDQGKRVFGFAVDQVDAITPALVGAITDRA